MQYTSYPKEQDELLNTICRNYEFAAADYPTAWMFREFLKTINPCDYSEILDDVYFKRGIIQCIRIIFFTCRPRDMERLSCVIGRFPWGREAKILDEEGEIVYGTDF